MTPTEIAAMQADREAGTKGPWLPMGPPTVGFMAVKAQPGPTRGFTKYVCNLEGIEAGTVVCRRSCHTSIGKQMVCIASVSAAAGQAKRARASHFIATPLWHSLAAL